ncbi:MAG: HEPN domain-containing protein [Verrucomicrobiota bacterium]|nr:HEPN domain-containing protein [Verrucomicrobiota bacterium]
MKNLIPSELFALAQERLEDARALFEKNRFEGAFYLCGYAVEMGLKYKTCKTLDWDEYYSEGQEYRSFKTHKFDELLRFSGMEKQKNSLFMAEWLVITKWDPEIRYSSKKQSPEDVKLMIDATASLLGKL